MDLDLEEQEQLATFKAFWQDYGRWIALGVAIAVIGFGMYWGYDQYKAKQSLQASEQYEALLEQFAKNDLPAVQASAKKIQQDYAGTAYAGMAGLLSANLAYAVNDKDAAIAQLQWVAQSAESESFQSIAKLRLVAIWLDINTPESLAQADKMLSSPFAKGFEARQLESRGDWYWAQDKTLEAKKSYLTAWNTATEERLKASGAKEVDAALKKLQQQNPAADLRLLKVKIDSLGGFDE
jgi:predicted negative regulator of RcsB-dependent stress response